LSIGLFENPFFASAFSAISSKLILNFCPNKKTCLDKKLPICKAQAKQNPERTKVREDFSFVQQRRRWVAFDSNII
jgi:hypothetical protein